MIYLVLWVVLSVDQECVDLLVNAKWDPTKDEVRSLCTDAVPVFKTFLVLDDACGEQGKHDKAELWQIDITVPRAPEPIRGKCVPSGQRFQKVTP